MAGPSNSKPAIPRTQNLHAPWRMSYMQMLSAADRAKEQAGAAQAPKKTKSNCFLREYWLNPQDDEKNHIIVRTGLPAQSAPGEPAPKEPGASATGSPTSSASPGTAPAGGLILLNKYPYANGHLLVCLGESRSRLLDYTEQQRTELWSLTDLAVELCERALMPQGVNVGLNQGHAAGAGVPEHVHVHVVPRWLGDVNFISVVGQVRVIPSALEDMAKRYREVWAEIAPR